jgi:hypothetical protein
MSGKVKSQTSHPRLGHSVVDRLALHGIVVIHAVVAPHHARDAPLRLAQNSRSQTEAAIVAIHYISSRWIWNCSNLSNSALQRRLTHDIDDFPVTTVGHVFSKDLAATAEEPRPAQQDHTTFESQQWQCRYSTAALRLVACMDAPTPK